MIKNNCCTVCNEIIPEGRQVCPNCESNPANKPSHYTDAKPRITTEQEAIKYVENLLNNWSSWREHHIALVQSLEIILAKIKEASKND